VLINGIILLLSDPRCMASQVIFQVSCAADETGQTECVTHGFSHWRLFIRR